MSFPAWKSISFFPSSSFFLERYLQPIEWKKNFAYLVKCKWRLLYFKNFWGYIKNILSILTKYIYISKFISFAYLLPCAVNTFYVTKKSHLWLTYVTFSRRGQILLCTLNTICVLFSNLKPKKHPNFCFVDWKPKTPKTATNLCFIH